MIDYFFIVTLSLAVACFCTFSIRNPAKRVAVVRMVFVLTLILPLILLVPGIKRFSCDFSTSHAVSEIRTTVHVVESIQMNDVRENPTPVSTIHSVSNQRKETAVPAHAELRSTAKSGILVPIQLAGMIVVALWQLVGYFRTCRMVRQSTAATKSFATPCRVRIHPKLAAPIIVGMFRPTILLPQTGDEHEIRCAIAHETAHWENGDLFGLALERLLMFPLLFHPLFWLLRRTVRHDQETLADLRTAEQVDRFDYTEQLLAWARRILNHPLPGGVLVLGIAERPNFFFSPLPFSPRNPFSRRIAMLLDETVTLKKPSRRWRWIAFGTLAAVTLCAATLTFGPISRTESPETTLKEMLKELVPTPTEKAAISRLRQLAFAEYSGKPKPPEAAPIPESEKSQVSLQYCFLSISDPLAKVFLADKSLCWSGLPIPKDDLKKIKDHGVNIASSRTVDFDTSTPGYCTITNNVPMPIQVRPLEESNACRLLACIQSLSRANVLQAPQVTLFSGQAGTIQDVSQVPFVTSVLPVEGDTDCAYQPIIQIFNEGTDITTKATLLEDHSCRIDYSNLTLSKIEGVEIVKLIDEGKKQNEKGKMVHAGVSLQSPNVRTLSLAIPPITVPEGMSLLVAVPGMFRKENGDGIFLLVTPRRVVPDEIKTASANPYSN